MDKKINQIVEEDFHSDVDQEELYEHYKFKADLGQDLLRIDKFLMDRMPNTSRNKIQNAAKNETILVFGKSVKPNYKVKPGDEISIVLPYPIREIELIPQDIPIHIEYEDDEIIVVNKPTNQVVHPAYGNYKDTLLNALVYHFEHLPSKKENYYGRPGLVHRIDKNTSGLLIIAKTENALTHLAKQFYDKTIERKYVALVWGSVKQDKGTIDVPIGRSFKNRKIMNTFPDEQSGKRAVTHYTVIERFPHFTLLECQLETGRTHQIRIHLKSIGHPLFNDPEYGGNKILFGLNTQKWNLFIKNLMDILPGQVLHAKTLGFTHPSTLNHIFLSTELPIDFQQILQKLKKYYSQFN
ncbi:MAG: RluA family pseudouridine synthase [Flavobacteriia bacterium]|nr:RluA family pseudouridine synthase [Flavobacteriia bacterium]